VNEFGRFSRRDPSHSETIRMNTGKLQQLLQESHPFLGHHITTLVMTFADASAGNKDAIRTCLQGLQDIMRRDRPCTHDPDRPHGRRILHSTDPSQVSRGVSSPRAQKSNNPRLKIIRHEKLPPSPSLPLEGGGEGWGCYFLKDQDATRAFSIWA
jgi:hypothetical protein